MHMVWQTQLGGHPRLYKPTHWPGLTSCLPRPLRPQVRKAIGPIATPDVIHWAPALPKTRSGKIMRRILRKIASREESQLGDTSTLADPSVVDVLLSLRPEPSAK